MDEEEPSADDKRLGPYGRPSWLADLPSDGASTLPTRPAPIPPFVPIDPPAPMVGGSLPPPPPPPPPPAPSVGLQSASGRRPPIDDPIEEVTHDWYAPAVVGPRVPPRIVEGVRRPYGMGDRVESRGSWHVVDTGTTISVSGRATPIGGRLVSLLLMMGIGYVFFLGGTGMAGPGTEEFVVAFVVVGAIAALLGGRGWAKTFLSADEHGVRLLTRFASGFTFISWDDIVALRTVRRPLAWPRVEGWFIETRDGRRVRIAAMTGYRTPRRFPDLRAILTAVAAFPTRFDRCGISIDGTPGVQPARFAHLPPPPAPRTSSFAGAASPPIPVAVGPIETSFRGFHTRVHPFYRASDDGDRVVVRRSLAGAMRYPSIWISGFFLGCMVVIGVEEQSLAPIIGLFANPFTLLTFGFGAYNLVSAIQPVLVADREGVRAGLAQKLMRWEDIDAFEGSTPASIRSGERALSSWRIRTRSGSTTRLDRSPFVAPRDWQTGPTDLQRIMEALSVFPTRFGGEPVVLRAK